MELKLLQGDCLELMTTEIIPDNSIDMILCDLPYSSAGNSTDKTRAFWDTTMDLDKLISIYTRVIKDDGAIVLFGNEPFSSILRTRMLEYYKYDYKWVKSKTTGFANSHYRPMNKYEDILIFSKANASAGGKDNAMRYFPQGLRLINKIQHNAANRYGTVSPDTNNIGTNNSLLQDGTPYIQKYTNYPNNVLYFDNPKQYLHPNQKPVELLKYLIKTYTSENDTVLDNCMGSGSSGVAALECHRNFIGIEFTPKYFEIAKDRIYKVLDDLDSTKPICTINSQPRKLF